MEGSLPCATIYFNKALNTRIRVIVEDLRCTVSLALWRGAA